GIRLLQRLRTRRCNGWYPICLAWDVSWSRSKSSTFSLCFSFHGLLVVWVGRARGAEMSDLRWHRWSRLVESLHHTDLLLIDFLHLRGAEVLGNLRKIFRGAI